MSSTPIQGSTAHSDDRRRWAALDSEYERLVDASDRLLMELDRPTDGDHADRPGHRLGAAS